MRRKRRPDPSVPECELDYVLGKTRLVEQIDGQGADQRRLLGGLGNCGISRSERRRDRAGEDRQREVPGRNAGEHATTMKPQFVLFTRRPRQGQWRRELPSRFRRVEAQEIDRLANLEYG